MKYIRDCVYNSIAISTIEEDLLAIPEVQRLHRILQNSTVYQTYPNNRTSRYSHSLGAMHVAGLLYKSLIKNSKARFVDEIHYVAKHFLQNHEPSCLENSRLFLIDEYEKHRGIEEFYSSYGWSIRADAVRYHAPLQPKDDYVTLNNLLFQAVRLAALVHDLGHPPFSHVVEFALKDISLGIIGNNDAGNLVRASMMNLEDRFQPILKNRKEKHSDLHEMIGIVMLNDIISPNSLTITKKDDNYLQRVFRTSSWMLALEILSVDQLGHFLSADFVNVLQKQVEKGVGIREVAAWYPIANIISSPVDCDRMDYLRRDPLSSGTREMTSFDFDRLVTSPILVRPKPQGSLDPQTASNLLVMGFGRRSLSGLSDFFYDRTRQYRWLVNHHNVVKTDLALIRLLILLYKVYEDASAKPRTPEDTAAQSAGSDETLFDCLKKHEFAQLWNWADLRKEYRYVDDSWLEALLQDVYRKICANDGSRGLTSEEEECKLYLEALLDRNGLKKIKAVWKHLGDYLIFCNAFAETVYASFELQPIDCRLNMNFHAGSKDKDSENVLDRIRKKESGVEAIFVTNKLLEYWVALWKKKSHEDYSPFSVLKRVEDALKGQFAGRICLVWKSKKPYEEIPIALSYKHEDDKSDRTIYLDELDSRIQAMNESAARDIKLYAYSIFSDPKEDEDPDLTSERREDTFARLGTSIAHVIYKDLPILEQELKKLAGTSNS
jgi:HD superfamily phosphohydrolase